MPTLRYNGMPDYLQSAAQRNLAATDASISRFNNRLKYVTSPVQGQPSVATAPVGAGPSVPSFSMSIAGPLDTSLGTPVSSFKEPTIAQPSNATTTTTSGNWRFQGFRQSGGYDQQVSPVVTPSNPTGTGTPLATSPVVPATYQPKDMSAQQKLYGWGSATNEEEE